MALWYYVQMISIQRRMPRRREEPLWLGRRRNVGGSKWSSLAFSNLRTYMHGHTYKSEEEKKHSYTRTRTTSTEEKQSERIIKLCCTPDLCSLTSLGMPDASRVYQQPACQQCWRSGSFLSPLTLQPGRHRQTGSGGVLWDISKSYSSLKLKRC